MGPDKKRKKMLKIYSKLQIRPLFVWRMYVYRALLENSTTKIDVMGKLFASGQPEGLSRHYLRFRLSGLTR